MKKTQVYILWHVHQIEKDNDDEKLIGVYSESESSATKDKQVKKISAIEKRIHY